VDNVEYADYFEEIKLYADSIRQKIDEELKKIDDELEAVRSSDNFKYISHDPIFGEIEARKEYLYQLRGSLDNKINSYDPAVTFEEEFNMLRPLVNGANDYDEMFQHLDDMLTGKNKHSEY